jgi:hypothetical protein
MNGRGSLKKSASVSPEKFARNTSPTVSQASAAEAAGKAAHAKDRAERLKGEDVPGGVDKPLTRADFLKAGGFTAADLRHLEFVASVPPWRST